MLNMDSFALNFLHMDIFAERQTVSIPVILLELSCTAFTTFASAQELISSKNPTETVLFYFCTLLQ